MLADDFLSRVALDLLRALVPAQDFPAGIEHENGIVLHFFHQCLEALLALAQGLFDALAVGHVPNRRRDQYVARFLHRAEADFDRERAAILAPPEQFEAYAHRTWVGRIVIGIPVLRMFLAEIFWNQNLDGLVEQFFSGVAKHFLRLRIDQQHPPAAIHNDHGVGRCFQQAAKFVILVAQTFIVVGFRLAHQVGNLALHQPQSKPPATLRFARHRPRSAFKQSQTGRGILFPTRDLIMTPIPRRHSRS